jgi:hypothetical protein
MLIYESTKKEFMNNCREHKIIGLIENEFNLKIGKVNISEKRSWEDSMKEMYMLLNDNDIPDNSGIAIEYNIPGTSNRIDFMISGYDNENKPSIIIIELKGWQEAHSSENKDGIVEKVRTFIGGSIIETNHPSYQAWSYSKLIEDFNENVQTKEIKLKSCSYLYRFEKIYESEIKSSKYSYYIKESPIYLKEDSIKLSDYIKKIIKSGDEGKNIFYLEQGKLRPSKSLQDSLQKMIEGNREFTLIDNQKIVYENALAYGYKSSKDNKKRVMIVEGGPGTGKSVVAINLMAKFIQKGIFARYVSKNAAPRNVYLKKLIGNKIGKKINPKLLFTGSGSFTNAQNNDSDILIVDEAHRLNEKSGMFKNIGENQIKEIIKAAKFSIFFIDENQRIDISDIGSKNEIEKYAKEFGVELIKSPSTNDYYKLESQFRCSGSDGYLAWLDDVLDIRKTANFNGFEKTYDFKVFDDPNELKKEIERKNINNKARLLAGYCWDWIREGKNNSDIYDIKIGNFQMSWNLGNRSTWAIDNDSINEVGCIHTCQGLEFEYVGVIIGDDLRYENEKIITDYTKRAKTDNSLKGIKTIAKKNPKKAQKIADEIIKNTYRTLMTRGMKGCYIYCTDKALSNYFKKRLALNIRAKEYPLEYGDSSIMTFTENNKKYNKDK